MGISKLIKEYINSLPSTKSQLVSKDSISHKIIANKIPNLLKPYLPSGWKIIGSDGAGRMAEVPWVGIFDPQITTTATKGIYIVFLFKDDMTGFYLSLNQGITTYQKKYKSSKYKVAFRVSEKIRSNIITDNTIFNKSPINLSSKQKPSWRVTGYEKTNIVSKFYSVREDKFSNYDILGDLNKFILLYKEIISQLNYSYDDFVEIIAEEDDGLLMNIGSKYDEILKIIPHRNIPLTYKEPNKTLIKGIEFFSKDITRKTDYISKVIKDHNIGLEGEAWVYRYEVDRLNNLGLKNYANKVAWVSKISDSYGYDIKSYDKFENGEIEEIVIEVKTTTNKNDTDFFISRNELDFSAQKSKNYRIFRIYNAMSSAPFFYIRMGKITDNFLVDPSTFLARLKI
jgi:hypothetical protein